MKPLATALLAILFAPLQTAAEDAPPAPPTMPIPIMLEEAQAAGIEHSYDGPWEYFVGGGVAILDCNGDRKPDLFLAGGQNPAKLYINESETGGPLAFRNQQPTLDERHLSKVTGAYPLDIDNDGYLDLVLLRVGENILLKGGPNCSFELANKAWGFDGGRAWTTAFAAEWEPGKVFPTLAFGNYVERSAPGSPWGTCHDNALFRPQIGDKPDYSAETPLRPGFCALSMVFTDWNRSGEPSLRISNDRHYYRGGEEQLWAVSPDRPPRAYRRADGWRHVKIWGMGIATADLDADGYPEFALTSMGDTKLQTLDEEAEDGRPVYRDIALEKRATAHRPYMGEDLRPSTGWHAEFIDINNDTLTDLFIAKGNVEEMPEFAAFDPDNLLLGSWDGAFSEVGDVAGVALERRGRGAGLTDFNNDGMLDLVVVNRAGPVSLFRNLGRKRDTRQVPMGNWLKVELTQEDANRNAVGAKVSVKIGNRTLIRDVLSGAGHASGQIGPVHIGLGVAERAGVRIRWPDGSWSHAYRVFANSHVVIKKGAANAQLWIAQ